MGVTRGCPKQPRSTLNRRREHRQQKQRCSGSDSGSGSGSSSGSGSGSCTGTRRKVSVSQQRTGLGQLRHEPGHDVARKWRGHRFEEGFIAHHTSSLDRSRSPLLACSVVRPAQQPADQPAAYYCVVVRGSLLSARHCQDFTIPGEAERSKGMLPRKEPRDDGLAGETRAPNTHLHLLCPVPFLRCKELICGSAHAPSQFRVGWAESDLQQQDAKIVFVVVNLPSILLEAK